MESILSNYNGSLFGYTNDKSESNSDGIFYNRIWGIDEVCSFTMLAKGTIYNLVSQGNIPYRKRHGGRRLVFIPSEIIE